MHWPCSALLSLLPALVSANTEIINFAASLSPDAPQLLTQSWQVLRAAPRTTTDWTLAPAPLGTPHAAVCSSTPCAHELWLVLEPTADAKHTLRLSYAASSPTDFLIDVLDPGAAAALLSLPPSAAAHEKSVETHTKYARIRAVDTGVRTPPFNITEEAAPVAFVLVLEPLYGGVLPATVVPLLLFAVPVLALASMVLLPRVQKHVDELVVEARKELAGKGE
ncbi:hypothetical protein B0H15DRAFT_810873 [Mycena belliarum]|uniref:Uncharacterized protein n=1 Tax=Mycena belliarum TaxID=1033014 RepID=A0AAD6UHW5_9AGAR|nr:hypothetical protein B0H15DRAFT_810873 [Mycena belliae]